MSSKQLLPPEKRTIENFVQALATALKRIRAEQPTEAPASNTQLPVATQPQSPTKEQTP